MLDLYLKLMALVKQQKGQDLVEYALIMGLIALVCILAITLGGTAVSTIWEAISVALGSAATVAVT
jgi:pilus assembly protein Flp/PilA